MFLNGAHYSCSYVNVVVAFFTRCIRNLYVIFQMPGLLSMNTVLPNFPNVWPYNTLKFAQSDLGVQLQMVNKLVKKAKTSLFFVIANGPREGEEFVHWQVRISNVRCKVSQHKEARALLQDDIYLNAPHVNGSA